jgi:hypothetical protein
LDALAKLQELYTLRDTTNTQIEQIEESQSRLSEQQFRVDKWSLCRG